MVLTKIIKNFIKPQDRIVMNIFSPSLQYTSTTDSLEVLDLHLPKLDRIKHYVERAYQQPTQSTIHCDNDYIAFDVISKKLSVSYFSRKLFDEPFYFIQSLDLQQPDLDFTKAGKFCSNVLKDYTIVGSTRFDYELLHMKGFRMEHDQYSTAALLGLNHNTYDRPSSETIEIKFDRSPEVTNFYRKLAKRSTHKPMLIH